MYNGSALKGKEFCFMRCVVQRVAEASVTVEGETVGKTGPGLMVLIGVSTEDGPADLKYIAEKVMHLRIYDDENGVMNKSILDVGGEILVVSQFTLWASYKKGNRPSYLRAGSHEMTIPLYERFCAVLSENLGKPIATGEFGADMKVELLNDGPVTICMDTKNKE